MKLSFPSVAYSCTVMSNLCQGERGGKKGEGENIKRVGKRGKKRNKMDEARKTKEEERERDSAFQDLLRREGSISTKPSHYNAEGLALYRPMNPSVRTVLLMTSIIP